MKSQTTSRGPKLGVAMLPQLLPAGWADQPCAAIVIDTLRFTSTACVALEAGAASIAVMSHIEAARQLATTSQPPMLLCGERHCAKIPGFDLGNSPLEYTPARVANQQLIFSTTNGTVAVEATQTAQTTALGSLRNRAAVAQWLVDWLSSQPMATAWIVCAGTDGQIAQEDVLTAGAILDQSLLLRKIRLINDSAELALDAWRNVRRALSLKEHLKTAQGGRNLIESGFAQDVEFVAEVDRSPCVPVLNGNVFVSIANR